VLDVRSAKRLSSKVDRWWTFDLAVEMIATLKVKVTRAEYLIIAATSFELCDVEISIARLAERLYSSAGVQALAALT